MTLESLPNNCFFTCRLEEGSVVSGKRDPTPSIRVLAKSQGHGAEAARLSDKAGATAEASGWSLAVIESRAPSEFWAGNSYFTSHCAYIIKKKKHILIWTCLTRNSVRPLESRRPHTAPSGLSQAVHRSSAGSLGQAGAAGALYALIGHLREFRVPNHYPQNSHRPHHYIFHIGGCRQPSQNQSRNP